MDLLAHVDEPEDRERKPVTQKALAEKRAEGNDGVGDRQVPRVRRVAANVTKTSNTPGAKANVVRFDDDARGGGVGGELALAASQGTNDSRNTLAPGVASVDDGALRGIEGDRLSVRCHE
jgi:hypothetical protein